MDCTQKPHSLFKHLTPESCRAVVESGRLRWSHPCLFNDDFDVPKSILGNVDIERVASIIPKKLEEVVDQSPGSFPVLRKEVRFIIERLLKKTHSERKEFFGKVIPTDNVERSRAFFESFQSHWAEQYPTIRVLCLTHRNDSLSMWDRYSESGMGAVLEFEFPCGPCSDFRKAQPVDYVPHSEYSFDSADSWAELMMLDPTSATLRIYKECLFTKTEDWSNEKEWRMIRWGMDDPTKKFTNVAFSPSNLLSITFGPRAEDSFIEGVKQVAGQYENLTLFKSLPKKGERRLESRPILT